MIKTQKFYWSYLASKKISFLFLILLLILMPLVPFVIFPKIIGYMPKDLLSYGGATLWLPSIVLSIGIGMIAAPIIFFNLKESKLDTFVISQNKSKWMSSLNKVIFLIILGIVLMIFELLIALIMAFIAGMGIDGFMYSLSFSLGFLMIFLVISSFVAICSLIMKPLYTSLIISCLFIGYFVLGMHITKSPPTSFTDYVISKNGVAEPEMALGGTENWFARDYDDKTKLNSYTAKPITQDLFFSKNWFNFYAESSNLFSSILPITQKIPSYNSVIKMNKDYSKDDDKYMKFKISNSNETKNFIFLYGGESFENKVIKKINKNIQLVKAYIKDLNNEDSIKRNINSNSDWYKLGSLIDNVNDDFIGEKIFSSSDADVSLNFGPSWEINLIKKIVSLVAGQFILDDTRFDTVTSNRDNFSVENINNITTNKDIKAKMKKLTLSLSDVSEKSDITGYTTLQSLNFKILPGTPKWFAPTLFLSLSILMLSSWFIIGKYKIDK